MQTILTNHWGHVLDGYAYKLDPAGLRTNILRNLGLTSSSVSVGYDNIGQLTGWTAQETNGVARQNEQFGFGFDAADNLHTRANGSLNQTFNADAENELTTVTRSGAFTLSGATPAPATNITVNGVTAQIYGDFTFAATGLSLANGNNIFTNIAQNKYSVALTNTLSMNLPSSVTLNYDNNGNLTNDGTRIFGYNTENQLTNVFVPGQWRSDFVYDGLGRRRIVREYEWSGSWIETNEIHIIYDGYLPIQERDINNNVLVTYTRGLDLSGSLHRAGGIGGLLARTDANGLTFYHSDGAGNVTALMDGQEDIVARYMYGPFGKLIGQWGSLASVNEMQFSSMPHDSLSGLSYYPFRAYEPNFQRWLNQDPIQELGGLNLYQAMLNNPSRYFDPLGLLNPGNGAGAFPGTATTGAEGTSATTSGAGEAGEIGTGAAEGEEIGGAGIGLADMAAIPVGAPAIATMAYVPIFLDPRNDPDANPLGVNAPPAFARSLEPVTKSSAPPIKPPKPPCPNKVASGFPGDENHRHHRLPRQFKKWFSASPRNLNIEDYTQNMPQQWHTGEEIGLHPNGYNQAWEDFINANPEASDEETLQFMINLENSMGFGTFPSE